MEVFEIEGTPQDPKVVLDKAANKFEISGCSMPDDVPLFYKPVIEWLDLYIDNPNEKTEFVFKLEYINTTSSKMIFEILKRMDKLYHMGLEVEILWYYSENDVDMEEAGMDYASIVELPFRLKSYYF